MTLSDLEKMGFENPEATFREIAVAGGFGAIEPNHAGGLDIDGITDKLAKAAVDKILSRKAVKNDITAK